jgi:hypothetical protein
MATCCCATASCEFPNARHDRYLTYDEVSNRFVPERLNLHVGAVGRGRDAAVSSATEPRLRSVIEAEALVDDAQTTIRSSERAVKQYRTWTGLATRTWTSGPVSKVDS